MSADRFLSWGEPPQDGVTVQFLLEDGTFVEHTLSAREARQFAAAVLDGADMADDMGLAVIVIPQPPHWHGRRGS